MRGVHIFRPRYKFDTSIRSRATHRQLYTRIYQIDIISNILATIIGTCVKLEGRCATIVIHA
jgi:hypothetical protein